MKARSEIVAEALEAQPSTAVPFWGAALLAASLGSWALILGAARLLAGF
jgi:hypothetical protein